VDRDPVPVFDGNHKPDVHFSGSRIRRGLYRTADGTCVNADLNGAANILRKAVPGAFSGMDVKAILRNINVVRFGNLYKVSG
jgi:putative transposase